MARKIRAPGVEINEFDRSQYGEKVDNSLQNAPVVLVTGFSDIGEDYTIQWINSKQTLQQYYGFPTNEAERYFYNACIEILNRGGYCITAKLPYYNKSKDKYNYVTYEVDKFNPKNINSIINAVKYTKNKTKHTHGLSSINVDIKNKTKNYTKSHSIYDFIFMTDDFVFDYFKCLNKQISSIKNRNYYITFTILQELIEFIDEKCDFEYEAKRIFNHIFYGTHTTVNYSYKIIKAIFECDNLNDILKSVNDQKINEILKNYEHQLLSMHNTLISIQNVNDFEDLILQFINSNSYEYYINYINDIRSYVKGISTDITVIDDDDLRTNIENLKTVIISFIDCMLTSINEQRHNLDYQSINLIDSTISSIYEIRSSDLSNSTTMTYRQFDDFKTGLVKPTQNQFYIVDISRQKYEDVDIVSSYNSVQTRVFKDKEVLGIVPVVTTPINAMYFQNVIDIDLENISAFNVISKLRTVDSSNNYDFVLDETKNNIDYSLNYSVQLSASDIFEPSISKTVTELFPSITVESNSLLDRTYLKQIGIVVLKMYRDVANGNKIGFTVLESFVGSLDRTATDLHTHENIYIGNRINTYSQYINFFSNVSIDDKDDKFDTYRIKDQTVTSLGFYKSQCVKDIHYSESILEPLNIILDHAKNSYSLPLDVVIDAGISNIAQFIKTIYWNSGYGKYDFDEPNNMSALKNVTPNNIQIWKSILQKFDNFCKVVRMNHDCMFIADGLRHFCLLGNEKKIRRSCHRSNFIDDIYPGLKYMKALDSSYSAGYCNWFYGVDDYSTDMFWMPPSIKSVGPYIYTDTYFKRWDAPAGLTRGVLRDVYDVAFNPTNYEAGKLYDQQWNYAISYPIDGIVVEGQKTFQKDKTALDRINVRRLLLYLEKEVVRIGRQFLYEGNTEYLRQRFVDQIEVLMDDCQNGDGIKDYAIKCDDENNTEETIENHELHVRIGLIPVKTIEFIVCDFIVGRQSANVTELVNTIQ